MPKNRALINAILDKDTTQVEAAKRAGLTRWKLCMAVNGHLELTADEKAAVAQALDVDVQELFPEQVAS